MEIPAILNASLTVTCPYCEHEFDLFEDDDGTFTALVFNNNWDNLIGKTFECPMCTKELSIKEIIW